MGATTADIASSLGLSETELERQALVIFLNEKKRQLLETRLELLARYRVETVTDLEERLSRGEISEHPTWEDLITLENMEARLKELDAHLRHL
jgi:hypothetical protein